MAWIYTDSFLPRQALANHGYLPRNGYAVRHILSGRQPRHEDDSN